MSINLVSRRPLLCIALAVVSGALLLAACSTEEDPQPDPGTLEVVIAPTSIDVVQGASGLAEVMIARGGSFTGAVSLSASGNPAGVWVTFSTSLIDAGSTTATVNVAVDAAVAAGTKTVVISAVADGPTAMTATTTLAVAVAAPTGSVSLSAEPTTLTAAVGAPAVTSTIAVARTAPFAGAVDLTVTGAPAGVTATVSPGVGTEATSTLSVSAAPGAVNGSYTLVIRGTGTGVADAIAALSLTITGGSTSRFALIFDPTTIAVAAGGASATSVLTLSQPFTRGLNLYLSGAPVGLTASFAPITLRTTSTLTVQAGAAVAPGTYILRVTGEETVGGIPVATATLPVVVSAAPALRQ